MPTALICSQADLEKDLGGTLLWRRDVERHVATRLEEARMMAVAAKPDVIVVDRDFPRVDKLVTQLREDPSTRRLSVVILARGDFDPAEVELLEAGANAILRLPPGGDWDERLTKLIQVPVRKDVRFPVQFAVDAERRGQSFPALALNLSVSGLLLESHMALTVGEALVLVMRLPKVPQPVVARGRVVRQAAPTHFGVEFHDVDAQARDRIRQLVDELAS